MSSAISMVIVGGGTAGWMLAAALSSRCRRQCNITLVESDDIGTVGVGEATLPSIKAFNDFIGIDEADMMRETQATFKLGIEFIDWGARGKRYIHPFGTYGESAGVLDFLQHWLNAHAHSKAEPQTIEAYSYAVQACHAGKFAKPSTEPDALDATYAYAYHIDATAYARYLRSRFEGENLRRIEGKVLEVNLNPDTGDIAALRLASGEVLQGDYFFDCTGFRSRLLGDTLGVDFDDWSQHLMCNRAVAVPTERSSEQALRPFTRATARSSGWTWNIPLQHRSGNGYVYASDFISDEAALAELNQSLEGRPLAEPKFLQFRAGRRVKSWEKNCIAVGLSSGFLEPLESTSLYLIQEAITHFLNLLPAAKPTAHLAAEFNRLMDVQYARIKDFLILHYHLCERDDSAFWRECRAMPIPESLQEKIAIFKKRAYVEAYEFGLFSRPSWVSVMLGQGLVPQSWHPLVKQTSPRDSAAKIAQLRERITQQVNTMPEHQQFLHHFCEEPAQ